MQKELARVIEQVSKEKGLEPKLVIEAVEDAMKSAARKTYGADLEIEAKYNEKTGTVDVYNVKTVVAEVEDPHREISLEQARAQYDPEAQIGDELLIKLDTSPFGRIAAQAAKQNIVQKVRDYERAMIYQEFKELHNTIQSGIVMRFERRNIIVQLRPNVDAVLPADQQIPRERYRQGDRIRALIIRVDESARGPQIVLSRTDPELVRKLFEQEVPEVYEGIVEIKKVVREPGGRAKIAVVSNDSDVDPVGACVGMRGSRVQAVVQELRGERIDIVPWTPDETEFVCRALSPAKVSRIVIDEEAHAMEVVVPDDQLSLAIGRKGQNVRLASKLTGWKLDVHSESDYEKRQRESRRSLRRVMGLGDLRAELLLADGYKSAAELAASDPKEIAEVIDVSVEEAAKLVEAAAKAAEQERVERMVLRIVRAVSEGAATLKPPAEEPAAEGSEGGEGDADVREAAETAAEVPPETGA
ncbi:MAG: transcription termination factor NusA [Candidatus Dadabacteria bacterium]|nr:MAG: transcription termination factor NusA [Candidatus Dadabacteria bacterium]